jgi:acyl dehydratase
MKYFEDFKVGETHDCGSKTVHKDEIVGFAREFDPQPFHVDEKKAEASPYGGLIASGWHTCALCMRLAVDGVLKDTANMGSPGVENLRWLKPVRPGDTIEVTVSVLEMVPSSSRPDRGRIKVKFEVTDHTGDTLMDMVAWMMMKRRPAGTPGG